MQEAVFTTLSRSPISKTYPINVSRLEQGDTTVATFFEPGWKIMRQRFMCEGGYNIDRYLS